MKDCRQLYIDGKWISPVNACDFEVISPATEEPVAIISLGSTADVDNAVTAAKRAFEPYSETTRDERLVIVRRIIETSPSRIVYVSCNPTTLAPNAAQLVEAGWVLRRVRPVDMFPQTPHIECVALLERG